PKVLTWKAPAPVTLAPSCSVEVPPPTARVDPPAMEKAPELEPPPESVSVPTPGRTSAVPVLLNATPTVALPDGPSFRNSPALLNWAVPPELLLSELLSGRTKVAPAWLFQTAFVAKEIEVPASSAALPWLSTVRPDSVVNGPERVRCRRARCARRRSGCRRPR